MMVAKMVTEHLKNKAKSEPEGWANVLHLLWNKLHDQMQ